MGTGQRHDYPQELGADLAGVKGQTLEVTTSPTANAEFVIVHELRRVPTTLHLLRSHVPGSLYASRVDEWSNRRIFAKFDGGLDTLLVRIA